MEIRNEIEDDSTSFGCIILKIQAAFHLEMPPDILEMFILIPSVLRRKVSGCRLRASHLAFPDVLSEQHN